MYVNRGCGELKPCASDLWSQFSAIGVVIILKVIELFGVLRTKVMGLLPLFSKILKFLTVDWGKFSILK
jgi:hypothetical protein